MTKILFVCHGNICRSPMAEFILKDLVRKAGCAAEVRIASAATSREERGSPSYPPAQRQLRSHGVPQAQQDTVRTPICFDLGGETPEELAIAILAQILLVKNRGRQALTDAKEDKA